MIWYNIAKKELASTNQNPIIEWQHEAPPLNYWVLCPKQNLLCHIKSKSKAQVSRYVAADNCALRPASFSWGSMNNEAFLKYAEVMRSPNSIYKIVGCEI